LLFNKDFYVGYSPERVNPGDKSKKLKNIKKIISGSKKPITTIIKNVYKKIIKAGVHEVSSIKVAEAAKVIENTQRDLNIALVNELSVIFKRLNIDTQEVLNAASTKWNFHHYNPGLVGGHCIGVDPYYLTYKAKKVGVNPKIILAGRRLNDGMAKYVAGNIEKKLSNKSRILIVGCTFKENCPDIRNSKIFDLYKFLSKKQRVVNIFDPIADKFDVKKEYGLNIFNKIPKLNYEVIVIAVPHKIFSKNLFPKLKKINKNKTLIFDLKSKLKINESFFRL
jgi:UDP-N-acetyl-D-galactosamine dehydrogenase